jgi:hypothetical protein
MPIDADIMALDLEAQGFKLCLEEGWTVEQVDEAIGRYRAFLHAIRHHPGHPLAPSKQVDTVWHAHILDTERYISDCQRLFGRYVHHYPYSGLLGEDEAEMQRHHFEKTQEVIGMILSS